MASTRSPPRSRRTVDAGVGSVGDGIVTAAAPAGDGLDAIITPWTVDVATAGAPAGEHAAPLASSVFEESPVVWSTNTGGSGMGVDAVHAAASSADGSSLADVMSQIAPDARLVASAAVLTFASEAILGARFVGPGRRRAHGVHQRPAAALPRQVGRRAAGRGAHRQPDAGRVVGGAHGAGSSASDGAEAQPAPTTKRAAAIRGTIESFVSPLRQGFEQATRDAGEVTDGFSDSRLMVQIGMALGRRLRGVPQRLVLGHARPLEHAGVAQTLSQKHEADDNPHRHQRDKDPEQERGLADAKPRELALLRKNRVRLAGTPCAS